MGCSHGAIATVVLLFQQMGINEQCSHGMIPPMILNPMQPIACDQ